MTRLRQPIRALLGLSEVLIRLRLVPSTMDQVSQPVAKRQASRPPRWMTLPGDQTLQVTEQHVAGRGGPVRVRLYAKPGTPEGSPVIVYLHGGGFVLGGLDGCDYLTRRLCTQTGFPVVSVEYRLAPECPFPGPLEDCEDALRWVVETRPLGVDPSLLAIAGDSAGGNLAVALALSLRDAGGPVVSHLTSVYPFTDTTLSSTDWDTRARGGVDRSAGERMVAAYAPGPHAASPLVNVLHADLAGLPPTTVITAEHDVLRTDGTRLVDELRSAGVPVVHREYDGLQHGFLSMPRLTKDADRCLDLVALEISAALQLTERSAPSQ